MSEVKRYNNGYNDEWCHGGLVGCKEDANGRLVKYKDYAALKSERDALANENLAIKAKIAIHAGGFSVCPVCSHEEPSESDDIVWMVNETPTPATDAYINAVWAEGAGAVAEYHKERFEFIKNTRHDIANEHKAAYLCALDVAAQLRAGE